MWAVGPPETKVFKHWFTKDSGLSFALSRKQGWSTATYTRLQGLWDTQSSSRHKKHPAFGKTRGWPAPDPAGRAFSDLNVGPNPRTGIHLFDLYHGSKTAPLCQGDPLAQVG